MERWQHSSRICTGYCLDYESSVIAFNLSLDSLNSKGASSCAGVCLTPSLWRSFGCAVGKRDDVEDRLWLKGEKVYN